MDSIIKTIRFLIARICSRIKTIKKIDKNIDTHLNEIILILFLKGFSIKKYDNKFN